MGSKNKSCLFLDPLGSCSANLFTVSDKILYLIWCCINLNVVLQLCNFCICVFEFFTCFCKLYFYWTSLKYLALVVILRSVCANKIWTLFNKHAWGIFLGNISLHLLRPLKKIKGSCIYSPPQSSIISPRCFKCLQNIYLSMCKLQSLGPL